jgi:outer membrane usher protein
VAPVRPARLGAWLLFAFLWRPTHARAQDQRAELTVEVNHVTKGEVLVVLRGSPETAEAVVTGRANAPGAATSDVLVGVAALESLGLRGFGGHRESIGGTPFVSLASLAPRLIYELDERALTLRLSAQPDLLDAVVRNLASGRPPDIEFRRDTSAFANYALDWRGRNSYDLFTDLGVSAHGAFFGSGVSTASGQRPVRGLTSATFDQPDQLRRLVVGDAFANGGLLGGGLLLGGVTFSKEYSVDPYFIQYPTFNLSGAVTTPTIAEIYVNDRLVRTEQLAPGQFSLAQLPIVNGRNDAHVVLRDAFGGVRDLSASYYLTTTVLAPGLQDYQYSVGFVRTGFGMESWSYGQAGFIARHRVGLTSRLTLGGRLEGTQNLVSGGPVLNLRLPFGELEAAGAVSDGRGVGVGHAASVGYLYATQVFSAGGSVSTMSAQYATTSLATTANRNKLDANVFVSVRTGSRTSLTLQGHNASPYLGSDTVPPATAVDLLAPTLPGVSSSVPQAATLAQILPIVRRQASLIGSARLTRRTDLSVTASVVKYTAGYMWTGSAAINVRLGSKTLASIAVDRVDNVNHLITDVQQPLPVGTGIGYSLHTDSGDQGAAGGSIAYQGPYGRYELRRDITGGAATTTLNVSGGIVAMNGGLFATRAVQDAFALVQVPDVEGVRAYVNNQEVGRTDKRGYVLVPNLLSYYGNVLNISDQDVPLERAVGNVRKTIAPPYHGGALAVFQAQRVQSAQGTILVERDGSSLTPAYGQLAVKTANAAIESPIGAAGEFYLENVPPGRHEATVEFTETLTPGSPARTCTFTLDMPASDASSVVLGALRCVVPQ